MYAFSLIQSVRYPLAIVVTARKVKALNALRCIDGNMYGAAVILPGVNLVAGYNSLASRVADLLDNDVDILAGRYLETLLRLR